jgi:hypothetical protein
MVFFNAWSDPIPAQDSCVAAADSAADSSVIEELVTAMLLQHQLNKPSFEYEHIEDAWAIYADGRLKPGPDGASADDQDQNDDLPPF